MDSASAKKQYNKLFKAYTSRVGGTQDFANEFEKQYGERTGYNQDLINQQRALQGQTYSAPSQLRSEYANSAILDPLKQEALASGRMSNLQTSLGAVGDLLNARGQSYQDILAKANNRYQQQLEAQRLSAEDAWRAYQDAQAQENARRAGSGGGGGSLEDLINELRKGQGGDSTEDSKGKPTPEKPSNVMDYVKRTVGVLKGSPVEQLGGYIRDVAAKSPFQKWADASLGMNRDWLTGKKSFGTAYTDYWKNLFK